MLEKNSCINTLGRLKGFLQRNSQPKELNALGKGVSGKSDRMTWSSKRIAWSQKFSSKSFWEFESRNPSLIKGKEEEEVEEEEEKPQCEIKFLEGIDFLGE